jgi:hypothetical protein
MKTFALSVNLLLACSLYGQGNAVTDWAIIVQPAIHSAAAPRPPASAEVLHTMVALAVYDAVVAVEGGYKPYALAMQAPAGTDVRAAVATAAYRTARARVAASRLAYLDEAYLAYLSRLQEGPGKSAGVQVGESAALSILAVRANDGFETAVIYECSAIPPPAGEFEPNAGCNTQPVDPHVGQIRPFTFSDPTPFRPDGPDPLTSNAYTEDFIETRDYGRSDSTLRSREQTDIAYFWSEHSYVHYFYRFWRPRTAIPRADTDGNPDTDPDPTWTPLITVNHPEYPAAHGFWSTALTDAVARFFGTNRVVWTIATSQAAVPQVVQTERTYYNLNTVVREIYNARVWAGLHWRHSTRHGAQIGRKVAKHVCDNFFRPGP